MTCMTPPFCSILRMLIQIGIKLVPRILQRTKLSKNEVPLLMIIFLIATSPNVKILLGKLVILETMKVFNFRF